MCIDVFLSYAGGDTLADAIAQNALGMFGYMTDPDTVKMDPACTRVITASGHDMVSLMFNFLDQCLYVFASDDIIVKDMAVLHLTAPEEPPTPTVTAAPAGGSGEHGDAYSIKAIW